ncbi:Uncharacterised protein [Mycobacterium tuberculosis]|nr:Uncharacterised protein [Mycobacterium tuberculosis]
MVGRLDVHRGDVVRQQHDLVGVQLLRVLSGEVGGRDQVGLQQPGNECARPGEAVQNMHALVGQPAPEMLARHEISRPHNEVHDLDRRVHDPQRLGLLLEADAEELLVQLGDHLLLALGARDLAGAPSHRFVKAFQPSGFGLQAGTPDGVDHLLHGPRHRVVRREVMPGEQRVEHRLGDQVLREHADRVIGGDRVIEVIAQPGQELLERRRRRSVGAAEQGVDTGGQRRGDVGDIGGPLLPIGPGANLVDDARVDRFLPLRQREHRQLLRDGGSRLVGGRPDVTAQQLVAAFTGLRRLHVQRNAVHHRVEALVVRPQRVEDLPHHLEPFVVGQRGRRLDTLGHRHRQDDVPVVLAGRLAHHPTDRLHHVDDGIARIQEQHRVQRGHVDPFGEAAGVGQDAAFILGDHAFEPGQLFVADQRVERPVHVAHRTRQARAVVNQFAVCLNHFREQLGNLLGRLDVLGERHRPTHRRLTGDNAGTGPLGQAIPAADDLGGVVEHQLAGNPGEFLLQPGRDHALIDGEHHHLVVGEQPALHRLAERQPVKLRPERQLVVHRHQLGGVLVGPVLDALGENPWRGGHIQPPGRLQILTVVHPHEVRLIVPRQRHAGGAVGLVAHHQVELVDPQPLGLGHRGQRLVGAKHHGQALGAPAVRHFVQQYPRVGGDRDRHIVDVVVLGRARHLGVRAHRERPHIQLTLCGPLPQRLAQQRNRGHQQQNPRAAAVVGGDALGDLERGERLAGAAGHDQLAAIVAHREPAEHRVDRLLLVRPQLVAFGRGQVHLQVAGRPGDVPVDRRFGDLGHADALHRDQLIGQRVLGIAAPPIRRGDDHPVGEARLARRGEKRVDVPLGQCVRRLVELALDRGVVAGVTFAGDQVDSGVGPAPPLRPVDPPPHHVVLLGHRRVQLEIAHHQLLELGPALRVRRSLPERLDDVVHRPHSSMTILAATDTWRDPSRSIQPNQLGQPHRGPASSPS